MPAFDDETFGPVAAITRVQDVDAAVAAANASQFGLSSNIWTRDVALARKIARDLYTGGVFINGVTASDPRVPVGGVKNSGYGRELSHFGARTFVNAQAETAPAPIGDSLLADPVLSREGFRALLSDHRPKITIAYETVARRMAPRASGVPKASGDGFLTAAQLFHALNEVRPPNAILMEESSSNRRDLHKEWKVTEPETFYSAASGILGWSLPAAVGIALAERDSGRNRPVIAVIGDLAILSRAFLASIANMSTSTALPSRRLTL
jgi:hypothetical protein